MYQQNINLAQQISTRNNLPQVSQPTIIPPPTTRYNMQPQPNFQQFMPPVAQPTFQQQYQPNQQQGRRQNRYCNNRRNQYNT